MFCKGFEELFKAKLELCVNVGPWSQTRMCESARGRHYNPIFETNQLLFLFLPLLKVHIDQSLQLQQVFLHPLPVDILASQHTRTHARNKNVQCIFFFFLFFLVLWSRLCCSHDIYAGTYIKVNSLSLRDFRGSELCDQRPVKKKEKKKTLLHPIF